MKAQFDIKEVIDKGKIESELELERALIADRKLKQLSKEDPKYKMLRNSLRDLIEAYENATWSKGSRIGHSKIYENDISEMIAEKERLFINQRKKIIKKKLKSLHLTQQQLATLLGHRSKSYMSELMNGVSAFSLKDLIIINKLLKIDLSDLIPTTLSHKEYTKLKDSLSKLKNDNLKLTQEGLELA